MNRNKGYRTHLYLGVARKLEDPEDSDQTDDPDYGQRHGGPPPALGLGQLRAQSDEVGNYSEEVDDVHYVLEEERLAGGAG